MTNNAPTLKTFLWLKMLFYAIDRLFHSYGESKMEVLTDILKGLRAAGSVYFCDFLAPPWKNIYQDEPRAMFHLVRRGRCKITAEDKSYELRSGDFVFMAPGIDHVMENSSDDDQQTLLLCGYCEFESSSDDVLMRALPRFVLLRDEELAEWPWLTRTLDHLSAEYMSGAPGRELTVNKLTEVLLVQLLRVDFGRSERSGIIAALRDKRLSKALTHVHERPGDPWTIERAAKIASMSRSGFSRKFKEALEMGFFDYLTPTAHAQCARTVNNYRFTGWGRG